MAGPPEHISPSQLWAQLAQIERPTRLVDFPRNLPNTEEPVGKIKLRVLSQTEQMIAAKAAEQFTRNLLKDTTKRGEEGLGYEDVYKNAAAVEVLYRCCLDADADGERPAFPSPTAMRDALTPDEVGVLLAMYLEFQSEVGPIVSLMSEAEMEAWITKLAEGGSSFPLSRVSQAGVRDLLMYSVSQLQDLRMARSSSTSQQEDSDTASLSS